MRMYVSALTPSYIMYTLYVCVFLASVMNSLDSSVSLSVDRFLILFSLKVISAFLIEF